MDSTLNSLQYSSVVCKLIGHDKFVRRTQLVDIHCSFAVNKIVYRIFGAMSKDLGLYSEFVRTLA